MLPKNKFELNKINRIEEFDNHNSNLTRFQKDLVLNTNQNENIGHHHTPKQINDQFMDITREIIEKSKEGDGRDLTVGELVHLMDKPSTKFTDMMGQDMIEDYKSSGSDQVTLTQSSGDLNLQNSTVSSFAIQYEYLNENIVQNSVQSEEPRINFARVDAGDNSINQYDYSKITEGTLGDLNLQNSTVPSLAIQYGYLNENIVQDIVQSREPSADSARVDTGDNSINQYDYSKITADTLKNARADFGCVRSNDRMLASNPKKPLYSLEERITAEKIWRAMYTYMSLEDKCGGRGIKNMKPGSNFLNERETISPNDGQDAIKRVMQILREGSKNEDFRCSYFSYYYDQFREEMK